MQVLFLILLVSNVLSIPLEKRKNDPSVTVSFGQFIGIHDPLNNVDSFKGIPFADPPIGNLRFRPPQPFSGNFTTPKKLGILPKFDCVWQTPIKVKTIPPFILDFFNKIFKKFVSELEKTEDCLYLNVWKPATATPNSKLPVAVWISGGGFEISGASIYDGTFLVHRSMKNNQDMIFVTGNYRSNMFGFLNSKQVRESRNGNLGLLDQRMLLQWVQKEISAFGGDPTRVTLMGESAGAISIGLHMVISGQDSTSSTSPLFHGAIMQSGAPIPLLNERPKDQIIYDHIVKVAECSHELDTLNCLRHKPIDILLNAMTTAPTIMSNYRQLDLAFMPNVDGNVIPENPIVLIQKGKIYRVPTIAGSNTDEGTLFSLTTRNVSNTKDFQDYYAGFFSNLTPEITNNLAKLYPEEKKSSIESLFENLFLGRQFKRLATATGDIIFHSPRRYYQVQSVINNIPTWSYHFTHLKLPFLGACHGLDLPFLFGYIPNDISITMQSYWISFVNTLNPNNHGKGYPQWTQYDTKTYPQIVFDVSQTRMSTDMYRKDAIDFIQQNVLAFSP